MILNMHKNTLPAEMSNRYIIHLPAENTIDLQIIHTHI